MRGWTVEIGIFAVATVIQKLRKQGITVEMVRVVGYTVDQRMQNGRLTVETMFYGDSTVVWIACCENKTVERREFQESPVK